MGAGKVVPTAAESNGEGQMSTSAPRSVFTFVLDALLVDR